MEQNGKQFLQSLQILYYALLAGQALLLGVLFFTTRELPNSENAGFVPYIVLGICGIAAGLGARIWRTRLSGAAQLDDLSEKLMQYRAAYVLRWALTEGVALIGMIQYFFVSGSLIMLGLASAALVLFITQAPPSKERLYNDLQMSMQDQQRFENPDEKVMRFKS